MSVPVFISIYSTGNIYASNQAIADPKVALGESGTLVTCVRILLTRFGKGTGTSGSRFTQKELT